MNMNEAAFYAKSADGTATCGLCPHNCKVREGSAGICGVRKNIGGRLYAAGYGQVSSIALDPVEKKPLSMFHPGKRILSVGGVGCNLRCPFCQNYEISLEYGGRALDCIAPERLAGLAAESVGQGNIGVAYTYNEPFVGYEYIYDCAKLVRERGLSNVIVTNGYVNSDPLEKILPLIDAMNIDLKAFGGDFYRKLGGELDCVKETIELCHKRCHVEITTLLIPGENDCEGEMAQLAKWLASLDPETPLHLTRFFPRYKYFGKTPAPQELVAKLAKTAGRHLKNVFPH